MSHQKRKEIQEQILKLKEQSGLSANAYAKSIGMSEAHFSNLVNSKFELIGDAVWRKLADKCNLKDNDWPTVETGVLQIITPILMDAKANSTVHAVVAHAGSGKSHVCNEFAQNNPNVSLITCEEGMGNKDLLGELLSKMGVNPNGMNNYAKLREIVKTALKKDNPLIIFDEWEKLDDRVRYYFITLYNKLEDKCGFVICSTFRLKMEIERGLKRGKRGYEEIFSRFGSRFILCPKVSQSDVFKVCTANGIIAETANKIASECQVEIDGEPTRYDMRRLKKLIKNKKGGRAAS